MSSRPNHNNDGPQKQKPTNKNECRKQKVIKTSAYPVPGTGRGHLFPQSGKHVSHPSPSQSRFELGGLPHMVKTNARSLHSMSGEFGFLMVCPWKCLPQCPPISFFPPWFLPQLIPSLSNFPCSFPLSFSLSLSTCVFDVLVSVLFRLLFFFFWLMVSVFSQTSNNICCHTLKSPAKLMILNSAHWIISVWMSYICFKPGAKLKHVFHFLPKPHLPPLAFCYLQRNAGGLESNQH